MGVFDNINLAMQKLTDAGFSRIGAAGLVSRWYNVESGMDPTAVNPSSGAVGIAQWLGSRKQSGMANWSVDRQVDYAIWELNNTERTAGNIIRNATTAYEASRGASMYERAEGYNKNTGVDNFTGKTQTGISKILSGFTGGNNGSTKTGMLSDENANKGSTGTNPAFEGFDALFGGLAGLAGSGEEKEGSGESGLMETLTEYFTRGIIVVLGFIFVAVGLAMFKPSIVPGPVGAVAKALK